MKNFNLFLITFVISLLLLFIARISEADTIFSTGVKYGPNGYKANGNRSVTTTTKKHSSTTQTVDTSSVENRIEMVPGFKLQTIPKEFLDLSFGAGYYLDNTVEVFIGVRL